MRLNLLLDLLLDLFFRRRKVSTRHLSSSPRCTYVLIRANSTTITNTNNNTTTTTNNNNTPIPRYGMRSMEANSPLDWPERKAAAMAGITILRTTTNTSDAGSTTFTPGSRGGGARTTDGGGEVSATPEWTTIGRANRNNDKRNGVGREGESRGRDRDRDRDRCGSGSQEQKSGGSGSSVASSSSRGNLSGLFGQLNNDNDNDDSAKKGSNKKRN